MEIFDVVVIGAGPGGYPAAIRAAQLGASVAIVEKEQLGGTCLNWGCIPTKALIAAADIFARIQHAQAFGIAVNGATVDYAAMIGHKNKVVAQLKGGIKQLLAANGVKQFAGVASFKDRNTIAISDGTVIGAKKVIIATGSTSALPGFLPKHERIVESRGFLDIDRLPKSIIILGGGIIGCELACMAAMLGVKVTIVELLEDILLILRLRSAAGSSDAHGEELLVSASCREKHWKRSPPTPRASMAVSAMRQSMPTCFCVPSVASP